MFIRLVTSMYRDIQARNLTKACMVCKKSTQNQYSTCMCLASFMLVPDIVLTFGSDAHCGELIVQFTPTTPSEISP